MLTLFVIVDQYRIIIVSTLSLHLSHQRHCSVVRYQINIVSTSVTSCYLFHIIYIIDIAISYGMESTSCRHHLSRINLFTLFTSSTLQCCPISTQHHVDITSLVLPCLHRSHREYYNFVRYRFNILSIFCTSNCVFIVHIVDIVILHDIESTSCRHRLPLIT